MLAKTCGVRKSITTVGVAQFVARFMVSMTRVVNSFHALLAGQLAIVQQTVTL
jgi:hypothetical protein